MGCLSLLFEFPVEKMTCMVRPFAVKVAVRQCMSKIPSHSLILAEEKGQGRPAEEFRPVAVEGE
jgi:hypothetical protein